MQPTPLTASRPATEGWWVVSWHHLKCRPGTEGWWAVSWHHLKYRPGTEGWRAVSRHHHDHLGSGRPVAGGENKEDVR